MRLPAVRGAGPAARRKAARAARWIQELADRVHRAATPEAVETLPVAAEESSSATRASIIA